VTGEVLATAGVLVKSEVLNTDKGLEMNSAREVHWENEENKETDT